MKAFVALGVLIGLLTCCYTDGAFTTCRRNYNKIGCLKRTDLDMELLVNDRDGKGHELDWSHFAESIHSLACRCSKKAEERGFTYFAIRFWAECWSGPDYSKVESIVRKGLKKSLQCFNHVFKQCEDGHHKECVGRHDTEYIYKIIPDVDGKYSEWSSFSSCSAPCGTKVRNRTCTKPAPSGIGRNCSRLGAPADSKSCRTDECPVNGGFSRWSSFSQCSKSCGVGYQSRSRSCTNPRPANGGRNCVGRLSEGRQCNMRKCPGPCRRYRLIGQGRSCHSNVYTRQRGRCDGWSRTNFSSCREKCNRNEAPSGCPRQKCKYVIWDNNRDWPPGWCQLATEGCRIGGANNGHQLWEKSC